MEFEYYAEGIVGYFLLVKFYYVAAYAMLINRNVLGLFIDSYSNILLFFFPFFFERNKIFIEIDLSFGYSMYHSWNIFRSRLSL